jgi:DNA-binding transcriptional regulator/RsmH inhibitor MraZ
MEFHPLQELSARKLWGGEGEARSAKRYRIRIPVPNLRAATLEKKNIFIGRNM